MKIATRKLHCPNCERDIKTREQTVDGAIHIFCRSCKELIWVWDGIKWREVRKP